MEKGSTWSLYETIADRKCCHLCQWESHSRLHNASISPSEEVGLRDKLSDKDRRGFDLKRVLIQSHILLIICKPLRGLLTNSSLGVALGAFSPHNIHYLTTIDKKKCEMRKKKHLSKTF